MKQLLFLALFLTTIAQATPCMMFATLGQSNGGSNGGSLVYSPVLPVSDGDQQCYTTDGINVSLQPLRDPIQQYYAAPLVQRGSLWPMFGRVLHAMTGSRIIVCNGNINGAGWISTLSPSWAGNSNLYLIENKVKGAQVTLAANNDSCPLAGIVLIGGETDAEDPSVTQASDAAAIESLISRARTGFNNPTLPAYIISIDSNALASSAAGADMVRAAEYQAAAATPNTYIVSPFLNLLGMNWLFTGQWHYNQWGMNLVGATAAAGVAYAIAHP